jgi:imidazole glycerol-phosphate synthase subunit HisH
MIHIVDYGLGNIQAFLTSFQRLGVDAVRAQTASDLDGATKLILPGVGAFDHAMDLLNRSGMRAALDSLVLQQRVPVLGICVGMQMLADSSEEGRLPGLGWVPGVVRHFTADAAFPGLPLPHMGWNDVQPQPQQPLFEGMELDARFYFLHSYLFACKSSVHVAAVASYGVDFSCAVSSGNVYGVQFHPEKSHHYGTRLLKNFADL